MRLHGGQPVIAVEPDGARDAAGLFSALWHRTAVSGDMVVRSATVPMADGDIVALTSLVNTNGNLDVVALGDWSTTTDLSSDVPPGKVPTALYISVSAAPGATETRPVASVFLNDILLGAKQLVADGAPEMISVDVPAYALLPRNSIVVRFQRQPASDRCREVPQAFPVSVLPGSYMQLGPAPEADDFASIAARLSGESQVVVRKNWLDNASLTLPNAIALANSSGISPDRASLSVVDAAVISAPIKPFLLLDVDVTGDDNRAKVDRGSVTIETAKGTTLFDASGLSDVAVFETKTGSQQPGLAYLSDGPGPLIEKPLRFGHGDVAVIGSEGVLAEVRTSGKPLETIEQSDRLTQDGHGFSVRMLTDRDFWFRQAPGILTAVILGGFILLLVFARSAKRRKRNDQS
nr:cellulose biosynthesis cyclic di-GMP-binding regulatory protein BcsB [Marinicella sp. W31]MDC2879257.1 cellulose biosynthesis cyclic di-GMP-binding regulatory protein BcsB [Marinicella sp. W31]